jgi:hypothetical protein
MVEGDTDADGYVEAVIGGQSEEGVARQLAGLAGRVEVRAPASVRALLADIGRALVEHYGEPSAGGCG